MGLSQNEGGNDRIANRPGRSHSPACRQDRDPAP